MAKRFYTVLVLPDATSTPRKFHISRSVLTVLSSLAIVASIAGAVLLAVNEQIVLMLIVIVLAVLLLALLGVLSSALNGIYRSAVYLYAEEGQVAEEFASDAIRAAFGPAGA